MMSFLVIGESVRKAEIKDSIRYGQCEQIWQFIEKWYKLINYSFYISMSTLTIFYINILCFANASPGTMNQPILLGLLIFILVYSFTVYPHIWVYVVYPAYNCWIIYLAFRGLGNIPVWWEPGLYLFIIV